MSDGLELSQETNTGRNVTAIVPDEKVPRRFPPHFGERVPPLPSVTIISIAPEGQQESGG